MGFRVSKRLLFKDDFDIFRLGGRERFLLNLFPQEFLIPNKKRPAWKATLPDFLLNIHLCYPNEWSFEWYFHSEFVTGSSNGVEKSQISNPNPEK